MTAIEYPAYRARPSWRWVLDRAWGRVWALEHAFERAKAKERIVDDTRLRIFFVLTLFSCAFVTLAMGATRAAVFSDAGRNGYAPPQATARADLVDRNGRLLAADLAHYALYLDPREVWEVQDTRLALSKALPELSIRRLDRALKANKRMHLIAGLTPQERKRVHELGLPGVYFEEEDRRVYPVGPLGAHLIGFSDAGGEGLAGAERALDKEVRDAALKGGAPVALSIDLRVQAALEDEIQKVFVEQQAKGAVGIVSDVHTGEIIAMASLPDFDPNAAGKATMDSKVNRAAASVFEMGSTFKSFSVAMGLDSGVATLENVYSTSSLRIGSRSIRDSHANGRPMTLREIYLHSSNIGTGSMALTAPQGVLADYYKRFGFFQKTPVELVESARPILSPRWDQNTVASASFGHAISVSPLALTAAMHAVVNGGIYRPLTLRPHQPGAPLPEGHRIIKTETSQQMLDLLRLNAVAGTGRQANKAAPGLFLGGKTGSAEKAGPGGYNRTKVLASFAAVFPTEGPLDAKRYFVLVMIDEPIGAQGSMGQRTGGWVAAPPAGRVINRIAPFLGVPRADPMIVELADARVKAPLGEAAH